MGVSITVDGIPVTAEEGTSVLKAALQAGIYIPHICSNPDPESIGPANSAWWKSNASAMRSLWRPAVSETMWI
jgi:predicted molibdopterin-dependent oxidoreductase YjgC